MRRPWLRAAQWLVGLAIIGFAARSLLRNWAELRSQPLEWRIEPGWLLLSALVVWSMYALLIVAWRMMLAGWGQRLDGWTAARIWTVSSLGKYLPGQGLGGGGHGAHGAAGGDRRRGPRPARRSCCRCWPSAPARRWPGSPGGAPSRRRIRGWAAGLLLLIAGAVAGVALLLWPPFLRRLLRLAAPDAEARGHAARGGHRVRHRGQSGRLGRLRRWRSGSSRAGCCRRRDSIRRSPSRCSRRRISRDSWRCSRPAASGCGKDCLFSCCRARSGSAPATALALASRVLLTITELGAAVPFLVFSQRSARVAP